MRLLLAVVMSASLLVVAGCSCLAGKCPPPPPPCGAPAPAPCSPCGK